MKPQKLRESDNCLVKAGVLLTLVIVCALTLRAIMNGWDTTTAEFTSSIPALWLIRPLAIVAGTALLTMLSVSLVLSRYTRPVVFLSHSIDNDSETVEQVKEALEKRNIHCDIAVIRNGPHDDVVIGCAAALRSSSFVAMFARESVSPWQTAEWFAAVYGNKNIVVLSATSRRSLPQAPTALSGYPLCDVQQVIDSAEQFAAIIKTWHRYWPQVMHSAFLGRSPRFAYVVCLVLGVPLIVLHYLFGFVAAIVPKLSQHWADYHQSKPFISLALIVSTILMASMSVETLYNIVRLFHASYTIGSQNRNRSTTQGAIDRILSLSRAGTFAMSATSPPDTQS